MSERAERLYEQARELGPESRTAFIEEACAEDPELRAELLSLMEQAESAEEFFALLSDAVLSPSPSIGEGTERADPHVGRMIGRYRILSRIGSGGMGTVYRAHDTRLDRDVALKFLPPHLSAELGAEERLLVEARAAGALEHPNVCTVHEIGETEDGRLFIAMTCYEGETLKERLAREPLPVDEAVAIAAQITRGLAAAHARGIVHRDVKPGNVMLTADGTAKLLDFGLAKVADVTLTRAGTTPGTMAYMSPEQARGDAVDRRSDLWSLGVVLYEMLAGVRPFRGGSDRALLLAILHEEPEPVVRRRPEIPGPLARIVERLLRKDAADRYASAEELLADLERSHAGPRGSLSPRRGWLPRRGWKRAGVVGGGLVVLAVAGWAMVNANKSEVEEIRRLAVLPLTNLTGDPQQEYFVAGMHDALVTELGQIPALTVISRQSTVRYQGSDRPMPVIARELGVDALVEGSVFLAGDSVRITVQLIRAEPEEHIWAGTYHGSLRNVLALQGEVARAIARAIHARAAPEAQAEIARTRPVNPAAQEAYLQGLYHLERQMLGLSPESERPQTLSTAIAYLEEAVALDPEWATAHAKLARAYHWIASGGDPDLAAEYYPKSKAAALRALALDETEAQAHASLGFVLFSHEWDWAGAGRSIQRAMELDPNSYHWIYALYLMGVERYEAAIDHYRLAEERHPLSIPIKTQLAEAYSCAGRHDEAIAQFEELAGEAGVDEAWIHANIGNEYLAKSMHAEAIRRLESAVTLSDSTPGIVTELANVYARAGRPGDARALVPWLEERSGQWYAPKLYVALGDTERAIAMVEAQFEENPHVFIHFRCSPVYRDLRREPRIQEIVRRIGFPN